MLESICWWLVRPASSTVLGWRTSTTCFMTRARTESANTPVSAARMITQGKTCWRPTSLSAVGLGRQLSEWRCRKKAWTSTPSRTTTNNSQPLTPYMLTLRLSPPKLTVLSSTQQRATLSRHNNMKLVVTVTLRCGVMATQKHQLNPGTNAAEHFNTGRGMQDKKSVG